MFYIYSSCVCIVPSGPPRNLDSTLPDPHTVILVWDPPRPEDKNGQILLYYINVTQLNSGNTFQVSTNQTTIFIGNLDPYTTYTFVVAASTIAGLGPFSSNNTVTTLEDGKLTSSWD